MKGAVAVVAMTAFLSGCGAATNTGPGQALAGSLGVELSTSTAARAITLRITATSPNTLTSVRNWCDCSYISRQVSEMEIRVLVSGNITTGRLLVLGVSDLEGRSSYRFEVMQAAGADGSLIDPSAFVLSLGD